MCTKLNFNTAWKSSNGTTEPIICSENEPVKMKNEA